MSWLLLCLDDDNELVVALELAAESHLSNAGLLLELLKKCLGVYWEVLVHY